MAVAALILFGLVYNRILLFIIKVSLSLTFKLN